MTDPRTGAVWFKMQGEFTSAFATTSLKLRMQPGVASIEHPDHLLLLLLLLS